MTDPKPFFLEGRKCPSNQFVGSVVWRLGAVELPDFAWFVRDLNADDPRLFSPFEISNAERDQEKDAGFTPGPCRAEFLARLKDVDHEPREALDGLIAAGIEDMRRAHATQLQARQGPRRQEKHRRTKPSVQAPQGALHRKAVRVRPVSHSRQAAATERNP